jgi:hypothetical protein
VEEAQVHKRAKHEWSDARRPRFGSGDDSPLSTTGQLHCAGIINGNLKVGYRAVAKTKQSGEGIAALQDASA